LWVQDRCRDEGVYSLLAIGVGHAPRDGGEAAADTKRAVSDALGEPADDPLRGQDRGAREEHRELVAADAGYQIALPYALLKDRADAHERLVPRRVPEVVVQGLEAVRVDDRDGQRCAVTSR
jgi:hypothetical protein